MTGPQGTTANLNGNHPGDPSARPRSPAAPAYSPRDNGLPRTPSDDHTSIAPPTLAQPGALADEQDGGCAGSVAMGISRIHLLGIRHPTRW